MNVTIVGGGPAGLYLAILLKKSDASRDVTVIERNAPDQTFGWGVVFSDETLSYLQENDRESFEAITKTFAHWDAIETFVRGRKIRSGGHGFSGIARRKLLAILQERCAALGVEMRYRTEVDDVPGLARACDVLVGADGVKSRVRATHEAAFGPHLDVRHCRYIWLGTTRRFDAFTFIFEENEHGVFQVHAYQFDENTSTFIVECDELSWRNAGLDRTDSAASIAYLEKLFAPHLDGHRLLANKSDWLRFATVRNEHWHHGNTVIIGDAAHTAHFSIGSGTKMAMEDSIALAGSLDRASSVTDALVAYERDRRPIVERTQWAAQSSLLWFENVRRYVKLEPEQLVFSMLTRSKKVTYENLKVRDRPFVEHIATWYAHNDTARARVPDPAPPPMFTPLRLRGLELSNRVVCSPMCMYSARDGTPDDFHLVHLGSRALGGAALIMTEMTDVSADARISPGCTGMYAPEHVVAWRRIVSFVHERSRAKIGMQLGHAGRKGSTKLMWEGMDQPLDHGNWPLISASPLPYFPHSQVPREMNRDGMDRVRDAFVRSAQMADEAGFDLLELHFAHGYLLASFISPLTNVRRDEYGGAIDARMRYPLEVFDAVRGVWPKDKPMSVRISAVDWVPGGLEIEEAVRAAVLLREHGCDIVDVSTGQTSPASKPVFGRMYQVPFSEQIRIDARVPTMTVGNISSADQVNTILAAGRADLCVLARPHLADPYWTLHAAAEQQYADVAWPVQYEAARPK